MNARPCAAIQLLKQSSCVCLVFASTQAPPVLSVLVAFEGGDLSGSRGSREAASSVVTVCDSAQDLPIFSTSLFTRA
eukprot:903573-Pyramimonas_sp.AAC.1